MGFPRRPRGLKKIDFNFKLKQSCRWCIPKFASSPPLLIIIQEKKREQMRIQRAIYRCHWANVFENVNFQKLKLLRPHCYCNQSQFYSISIFSFLLIRHFFSSTFFIQLETYNGDSHSSSALCFHERKLKSVELPELAFYKILCWTQFTHKVVFRSKCTCFTPCTTYHSAPDWNPIQAWYRQTAWGPWKLHLIGEIKIQIPNVCGNLDP